MSTMITWHHKQEERTKEKKRGKKAAVDLTIGAAKWPAFEIRIRGEGAWGKKVRNASHDEIWHAFGTWRHISD